MCSDFFFLVLGKKQIQIPSFKADEGLGAFKINVIYLDAQLLIEKFKFRLKELVKLIPVKLKCLVFAIQHMILVVSQALLFSIFTGTTPLSAEMLQLSGNTTGSTFRMAAKHWGPKTLSWISAAHSSLEKLSTVPVEALPAKSLQ